MSTAPTPFPRQIRLENTNACNAHCTICPREALSRKIGIMREELLDRILAECRQHPIDKFTLQGYGEPLLDKHFGARLRKIKDSLGCPTFTVSNGSCIDPELADELVDCGLDKIKISLYGVTAAEYEAIHTPLKYEQTCRSIMNLVEAKRRRGSDLVIRVQYIGSLWHFPRFVWQWFGKVSVGFNTLHNYGGGRQFRPAAKGPARCPMLADPILQVLWNGDVVPCCYDFNGTMILGNLFEQSIAAVWEGEPYRRLRQANADGDFRGYPVCMVCDRRK